MKETSYKRRLAHNGETLTAIIKPKKLYIYFFVWFYQKWTRAIPWEVSRTAETITNGRILYTTFIFFPVRSNPVTTDPKGEALVGSILLLD